MVPINLSFKRGLFIQTVVKIIHIRNTYVSSKHYDRWVEVILVRAIVYKNTDRRQ